MTPRWEALQRRRLNAWGMPHKRVKPLRVWRNAEHGAALAALPFDLVWATTWEQEANDYVAPVLDLPSLPFIAWPEPRPEPGDGVFWKTPQIVAWAQGRSFAWIDDEITDADHAWVRAQHDGHALLRRIGPRFGLTAEDFFPPRLAIGPTASANTTEPGRHDHCGTAFGLIAWEGSST